MSAGLAHQPSVTPVATNVGACWVATCPACPDFRTPPMSKEGATLAADRHAYEKERGATSLAFSTDTRKGRSV